MTSRATAFRAKAVCGWETDPHGQWVTLNPGQTGYSQTGYSQARCNGPTGTGAGSVDWEED